MHCKDIWKRFIPPAKLDAYKQLIAEGQILKHHVIYNRRTGATTVEYFSTIPHEWIREELKKRSEHYEQVQISL
jgi:hypothetical protein